MAKPKLENTITDAFGNTVSLSDTYNEVNITPNPPITKVEGTGGTGNGPVTTSGSVNVSGSFSNSSEGSGGIPNFASSPYGDLELTKYLYESGLQNIFSDYQKNIQTLQREEAQQLQQAYAIRELSKKYLGEYASNIGVGDVSGNLLDIYTQYAQNATDIQKNFAALEMNLTREYTMERMNTFNKILETDYQINVAELDDIAGDASRYVFENFADDVAGGLAYLETMKDKLRPDDYETIADAYYRSNVQSIIDNVSSDNPWFGFSDLETQTVKEKEQYLEEIQKWMKPEDFNRVREVFAIKDYLAANEGEISMTPVVDIDASFYSNDPAITSDSLVYELNGVKFAVSSLTVTDDIVAGDNGVTPDVLYEQFEKQSGIPQSDIQEGQVVNYRGFYIFQNGSFYRMHNISSTGTFEKFGAQEYVTWSQGSNQPPAGGIEINWDGPDGADVVTYKGKEYIEDLEVGKWSDLVISRDDDIRNTTQALIEYLNTTFLTRATGAKPSSTEVEAYVPKGTIFFYNNQFYVYTEDGQKIRPLVPNEETQE